MVYWLRIGQAARLLDLSVDTLRKWDRRGRLRARRTRGDHRRYALPDIQALAARLGRGPAAPLQRTRRSRRVSQSPSTTRQSSQSTSRALRSQTPIDRETAAALRRLYEETATWQR